MRLNIHNKIKVMLFKTKQYRTNIVILLIFSSIFLFGCMDKSGIQQTNTYPVEIFSEMHYSQAYKSQEPPRIKASEKAVVFKDSSEQTLLISKKNHPYNEINAKNLYRVNCSMCHGTNLDGNGPVAEYIISEDAYAPYEKSPPNLLESTNNYPSRLAMVGFIQQGLGPMPEYGKLLNESDIFEIVTYIYKTSGTPLEEEE